MLSPIKSTPLIPSQYVLPNPNSLGSHSLRTPTQPPRIWAAPQDDLCCLLEAPSFVEAAVFLRRCLQATCVSESVGLVEGRAQQCGCQALFPALRLRGLCVGMTHEPRPMLLTLVAGGL